MPDPPVNYDLASPSWNTGTAANNRGKSSLALVFESIDEWFRNLFPPQRFRRFSFILGVLGAIGGYAYAAEAGVAAGWYIFGGALIGFASLMLLLYAIKALTVALMLACVAGILFVVYKLLVS
jgi:hypothetical protein